MMRYQVAEQSDLMQIHETSLKILEEVGVIMAYKPACELLLKHGAKVEGKKVFFPRKLVEDKLKLTPSSFTLYSRNPNRNIAFNMEDTHYCGPGGSCFVADMDHGRRPSKKEDFINLIKLYQSMDLIEMHHVPCEMTDVDPAVRNKAVVYETMKYSDKPLMPFMFTYEEAKECIEMAALPFGGLEAVKNKKPVLLADPCTVTPLCYDDKALATLMAFAEYGQIQLINSLAMAGATAPVTLAGNVAVQNAEILAGIVLAQCVNPGTPVIYSASGSNANMRTCSLTVGSPECALMSLMNGQLAKFYHLPCRISGTITDSKCFDAQLGYESMMNLMTAEMAGGNFILHGGGIMATYDTVSFEKSMIDYEMMGIVKRIHRGIEVNEETLAYDVIKEVGPRGQFLTEEHTFEHFREEHYLPFISDSRNVAQWESDGKKDVSQRANEKWKQMLEEYEQPDFPKDLDNELKKHLES